MLALDVHRGLTIAAMIFVNYLGSLPHIPPLLLHADERPDTITLPDLVFPGFLLIVGLSLPLAFESSQRSLARTLLHVAVRSAVLILAGVVIEFHQSLVPSHTGMSEPAWMSLFYVALVLLLLRLRSERAPRWARLGARGLGAALLVCLLLIFRGPALRGGGYEWLHHEWWGILGIIGWSYAAASIVYLAVAGRRSGLAAALGLMLALYIGSRHGALRVLGNGVNQFWDIGALFGSSAANVVLGALAGTCFVQAPSPRERIRFWVMLALASMVAGALLRPLHGFSKNEATESFTLFCGGLQLGLFAALYAAVDLTRARRWARPIALIGQNAMLAYILPDALEKALLLFVRPERIEHWLWPMKGAALLPQLANTSLITALVLALCLEFTRRGLRLRL